MVDELTPKDVGRLSEAQTSLRLEVLGTCSRILAAVSHDYGRAVQGVLDVCVPAFADLCAVELAGDDGLIHSSRCRVSSASGLIDIEEAALVEQAEHMVGQVAVSFGAPDEPRSVARIRERLGAGSAVVAPIVIGGVARGWLIMATGPARRGFRPRDVRVIDDLAASLAAAIQRVLLQGEVAAASRRQEDTGRRLRRLAATAANLAGAGSVDEVLRVGCVEACIVEGADAAAAQWITATGESFSAVVGKVEPAVVEEILASGLWGRVARGPGWIVHPLACSDEGARGAMAVFCDQEFTTDQEVALGSIASFVPVAFERALSVSVAVRQEAWMRAVVECSPVALIGLEAGGSVVWANTAAYDLLDVTAGGPAIPVPDALRAVLRGLAEAVSRSGAVERQELLDAGLDLSISAAPMPDAPGEEGLVLAAVTDMTERRAVERALLQAQRLEAMGQVAGGIAHDFNNLLTVIGGYAKVISQAVDDPRVLLFVGHIEKAANRAGALTQQLLGFTRPRLSTGVVIDLAEAVQSLRPVLERLAGASVLLQIEHPGGPVKVLGDPAEAEQAVLNLAINARDAMDGHGVLGICVEALDLGDDEAGELGLPAGRYAQLSVSDTGSGMSEEVRERCLEPFFTTKDRGKGTGLGLWTVYAMAADRGGALRIDSKLGEGTKVGLVMPRCETADPPAVPDESSPSTWRSGRRVGGTVLLVEDEEEVRQLAEQALTSIGLDVVTATQGEEALVLARTRTFDVVVTDIVLPGMSGVDLAARLRRDRPEVAVLFVSGYADRETRRRGLGAGAQLLRKPYRIDDLCVQVADLVEAAQGSKR